MPGPCGPHQTALSRDRGVAGYAQAASVRRKTTLSQETTMKRKLSSPANNALKCPPMGRGSRSGLIGLDGVRYGKSRRRLLSRKVCTTKLSHSRGSLHGT